MVTAVYTPPVSRELANENCSMRGSNIAIRPGSSRAASTAVEHLRVGERRLEDLLDDVFVRRAELRLIVDARARFLVNVVAGFSGDDHTDLGGRGHDERLGKFALGSHRDRRAATEHPATAPRSECRVAQGGGVHVLLSFVDAAGLTEHVDLHRAFRATDRETDEGPLVVVAHGPH